MYKKVLALSLIYSWSLNLFELNLHRSREPTLLAAIYFRNTPDVLSFFQVTSGLALAGLLAAALPNEDM